MPSGSSPDLTHPPACFLLPLVVLLAGCQVTPPTQAPKPKQDAQQAPGPIDVWAGPYSEAAQVAIDFLNSEAGVPNCFQVVGSEWPDLESKPPPGVVTIASGDCGTSNACVTRWRDASGHIVIDDEEAVSAALSITHELVHISLDLSNSEHVDLGLFGQGIYGSDPWQLHPIHQELLTDTCNERTPS